MIFKLIKTDKQVGGSKGWAAAWVAMAGALIQPVEMSGEKDKDGKQDPQMLGLIWKN